MRQRGCRAALFQLSLLMYARSMSMLPPRAPLLPLILVFALSFCCGFRACHSGSCSNPQHLVGSFWDVPQPTLHEKIYVNHHHHHHYQHHHQSRNITTLPAFAYISSDKGYVYGDYDADVSMTEMAMRIIVMTMMKVIIVALMEMNMTLIMMSIIMIMNGNSALICCSSNQFHPKFINFLPFLGTVHQIFRTRSQCWQIRSHYHQRQTLNCSVLVLKSLPSILRWMNCPLLRICM